MAATFEDQLIDRVRARSPEKQQEALKLLDALAGGVRSEPNGTGVERQSLWQLVEEIKAELPAATWDNVPVDGSIPVESTRNSAGRATS